VAPCLIRRLYSTVRLGVHGWRSWRRSSLTTFHTASSPYSRLKSTATTFHPKSGPRLRWLLTALKR